MLRRWSRWRRCSGWVLSGRGFAGWSLREAKSSSGAPHRCEPLVRRQDGGWQSNQADTELHGVRTEFRGAEGFWRFALSPHAAPRVALKSLLCETPCEHRVTPCPLDCLLRGGADARERPMGASFPALESGGGNVIKRTQSFVEFTRSFTEQKVLALRAVPHAAPRVALKSLLCETPCELRETLCPLDCLLRGGADAREQPMGASFRGLESGGGNVIKRTQSFVEFARSFTE